MSVPKWRRSGSKLDAFYEAVKLRHIVTQMIMCSYGMKTKHKSLIPDRLRNELFDDLFIRQWRCQENVERKQRNDYEYRVKFGEKQYPARRRHGLELESEWG